jgi:hypothetical protein
VHQLAQLTQLCRICARTVAPELPTSRDIGASRCILSIKITNASHKAGAPINPGVDHEVTLHNHDLLGVLFLSLYWLGAPCCGGLRQRVLWAQSFP